MKNILTLVSNEQVVFVESDNRARFRVVESLPLGEVLNDGLSERIAGLFKGAENALLLVPDYWLGIKSYPLATTRSSIVTAFIRKKLQLELGEEHGGEEFFDYIPYTDEEGERGITVFFSHEPHLVTLHDRLARSGITPRRITTPGLLWESKLRNHLPDFAAGTGKLLIYAVGADCFFYFFNEGRFLFSRDLGLAADADMADRAETLAFEIQQSRFLFAQKARNEIDQIYFVSARTAPVDLSLLAERIGRTTASLDAEFRSDATSDRNPLINPLLLFAADDWGAQSRIVNIAHRRIRTETDWKWPQTVTLCCGGLALAVLAGQAIFVGMKLSKTETAQRQTSIREQTAVISELSGRLDEILQRRQAPTIAGAVARLAQSLPAGIMIESFKVDAATGKTLQFNGIANADGPDAFRQLLIALVDNVRANFPGNEQLTHTGVLFEPIRQGADDPLKSFKISFQVTL